MGKGNQVRHNVNLDILRWIAALTVVFHHLINIPGLSLDHHYILQKLVRYSPPGHLSVLVFFVLSGYVISINTRRLSDFREIRDYARKRIVRIFPVYIITVVAIGICTVGQYTWGDFLANLFCVSVPFDNVFSQNQPAWSLNYELFYYFIFIFISYFRVNLRLAFSLSLAVALAGIALMGKVHVYPLIISYFIGFIFWIAGAMLAKMEIGDWQLKHSRLAAVVLLMFCMEYFMPMLFAIAMKLLRIPYSDMDHRYSWFQQSIPYADMLYLPFCMLMIACLARIHLRFSKALLVFVYGTVAVLLFKLYRTYGLHYFQDHDFGVPIIIYAASLVFWMANFNIRGKLRSAIRATYALSNISYALYIIHYPLIIVFALVDAGSVAMFVLKFFLYMAVLFGLSYLLEDKYQPFMKRLLIPKKTASAKAGNHT